MAHSGKSWVSRWIMKVLILERKLKAASCNAGASKGNDKAVPAQKILYAGTAQKHESVARAL